MAMNMDALLRIVARVSGADSIRQLTERLTGSERAANRLTSAGRLMGAAFAAVGAADLARRMGEFSRSTLAAGEQSGMVGTRIKNLAGQYGETAAVTKLAADSAKRYGLSSIEAAEGVADLYGRLRPLGIGLADIKTTFTGVNNAAKVAGLTTNDAKEAFLQLGQAMGSGKLQGDELRSLMERMPAIGRAIVDTFNEISGSTKVTVGDLKQMGADGLITTDILVMAMKKLEQITPPPPTAMQQFTAAMADLRMELGQNLLPILTPGIQLLTGLIRAVNALPGPIKAVAGGLMLLVGAVAAIALPLSGLIGTLSLLAGTGLKTAIVTSLGGVLAWIGTTFVPTMLAFFSGPAGWITLAVIAVGAMVIAFREPIGKFLAWVGEGIAKVAKTIGDGITGAIGSAWQWLTKAVGNVAQALAKPFEVAVGGIKAAVRGVLQYVANSVNIVTGLVNSLIRGFNRLPGPDLPEIPFVTVPSFAGGGYTGSGPRSGGIDGRGGFMAMLHPQETVIDHTRGAAAALGSAATAAASAPSITIQTGPILQQPDGSQWVSVGDLQAAMQATAAAVMGTLRTPGARVALRGA